MDEAEFTEMVKYCVGPYLGGWQCLKICKEFDDRLVTHFNDPVYRNVPSILKVIAIGAMESTIDSPESSVVPGIAL
jgi:hypothetical protein